MTTHDEYLARLGDPNRYGEQDRSGVDLSLIREILKLSPTERLRRADRARRDALRLHEYGRKHREKRAGADR
jgi:hypothetical protein